MPAVQHRSIDVAIREMIFTHKRAMVRTFCGVMLVVVPITFLAPHQYTSEAKLFVRLGRRERVA